MQEAHEAGRWLAGYLSYEAGYLLEPKLKPLLPEGRKAPLLCFGVFDGPSDERMHGRSEDNAASLATFLRNPVAQWSFDDYAPRFKRLHQHLREGDCYQGNLTFPVHAEWGGHPLILFNMLAKRQPVRYATYCDLGGPIILSRSPELFFEVDGDGWIETHPMKGTMPRGATPEEDEQNRQFLLNDPKNQAENRMIVDLLRNDISLVSEVGSLDVPELFRVETYPTVHQMISRVRARLKENLPLRSLLPPSSRAGRSPARRRSAPWKSCVYWRPGRATSIAGRLAGSSRADVCVSTLPSARSRFWMKIVRSSMSGAVWSSIPRRKRSTRNVF